MPDSGRRQRHIADPGPIDVSTHRKQGGLGFFLLNESTCHHEAAGLGPAMETVFELSHLPVEIHGFIGDTGE
jgi:hypothetical protein